MKPSLSNIRKLQELLLLLRRGKRTKMVLLSLLQRAEIMFLENEYFVLVQSDIKWIQQGGLFRGSQVA